MLLLGMVVLGLAAFAAMFGFVDAVRAGVGDDHDHRCRCS